MTDPLWLAIARRDLGVRETPGKGTTPAITRWLIELNAWWRDDETPWCGVACAHWVREAGVSVPRHYYRARAWLEWGAELKHPTLGCIVVFDRSGGGHVGLAVGKTPSGNMLVLGGNQGDRVSIAAFSPDRVLGHRWPLSDAAPSQYPLPTFSATQPLSTKES